MGRGNPQEKRYRGRWFRFYESVLDDPKIQLLTDAGKVAWMNCLCIASRNDGMIPDDTASIAFAMRKPPGKVRDLLQVLLSAHLVDRCDGGFTPHNWHEFQYVSDDAATRARLYRERKRHETERGTSHDCPVPESDTDTDTEKEKKKESLVGSAPPKPTRAVVDLAFEQFWKGYPTDRLMSKKQALGKWQRMKSEDRKRAVDSLSAFRSYCVNHPDYRPVHAERYLGQRRFDGFLAPEKPPAGADLQSLLDQKERALKMGVPTNKLDKAIEALRDTG